MIALSPSTTIQAVCDEIADLQRQIAWRDAQIKLLTQMAFCGDEICRWLGLRKLEYRVLFHLVSRAPAAVPVRELMDTIYPNKAGTPDSNVIVVVVCRLRKKLAPLNVQIWSLKRGGYQMDAEALGRLRAAGWGLA